MPTTVSGNIKNLAIALLLCAIPAFSTTTVTGHISNLDTTTPGATAYVRFWLHGCGANQPRITGTGGIAPRSSANSNFYVDLPANASGNVSGVIYSTRDSSGTGNGEIECGGSYTAVYYGMQIYSDGPGPEIPIHAKIGATIDISNVTPITTLPVVTAPNGDSTYLKLTGGNSPVTGPVTFQGANTFTTGNTFQGNNTFTGSNTFSQTIMSLGSLGTPATGRTYANPAFDFFSADNSVQTTNSQAKSDSTAAPLIRARSWQFGGATVAPYYLESFGFGTGSIYGIHGQIDNFPTWRGVVEANNIVVGIDNEYQISNIVLSSGTYTITITDGSTPAYLGGARVPNCQVGDSLHIGRVTDSFYNNGNAVGFPITAVSYPGGGPYTIQFSGAGSHAASSGGVVSCWQGQVFAFETNLTNMGPSQAQFLTPTMEQNFTGIYGHTVTASQGNGDDTAANYVVGIQGKSTEGGRFYIGDLVNDTAEAGFRCGYYKSGGATLFMPICTEHDQRNIATSGGNFASIPDVFHASFWNGSSATDAWGSWNFIPDSGTNPLVWHTFGYHTGALNAADTVIWGVSNNGALKALEAAAPSGIASYDLIYADSTAHAWKVNNNNGGAQTMALLEPSQTFGGTQTFGTLKVSSGGTAITNVQHLHTSTGSIGATTRTEIVVSWPATMNDTNYAATCSVEDSTTAAGTQGLTLERIRTKSATQVGAVINNPTAGAITGTLDCIGMHN